MQRQSVLLTVLLSALLVARNAAGPIRAVAQPESEPDQKSGYVFVKLLFEGHDQPNFDKWHANATAAAVAKAAGVPVNYLIRLEDGELPAAKDKAPAKSATSPATTAPAAAAAAAAAAPGTLPGPVPAAATPAPAVATPVALPTPAAATPAAAAVPPAAAIVTTPSMAVNMISDTPAPAKPAALTDSTTNAKPESGASELEPKQTLVLRTKRPRVFILNSGRKLLGMHVAPNQALAEYAIRTNASEPWAVRETVKRKLMASAANFGMASGTSLKGFYSLLRENGVSYYHPSMWVDGQQILSGQVAMEAPPNRFVNGTSKNFQHKLYKHTDLVKPKTSVPTKNVTVAEPAFVMANRSTSESVKTPQAVPKRSGVAPWMVALIVLGGLALAAAIAGTVWRCHKERKAKQQEADAAHSEPLSPHSVQSHAAM